MQGDARGSGLLLASVCDLMVGSKDRRYRIHQPAASVFPSANEERFFVERFGKVQADELLYRTGPWTGEQLLKGWICAIVRRRHEVDTKAMELASDLAPKSHASRACRRNIWRVNSCRSSMRCHRHRLRAGRAGRARHSNSYQDCLSGPVISLEDFDRRSPSFGIESNADGIKQLVADLSALF